MVDMWDSEEGYICQGTDIGFCTLGTAAVAGECMKFGTSVANQIVVSKTSASGDAIGIAKKGGVTGDVIPVVFYGVVKLVAAQTVTVGQTVKSAVTAGTTITFGNCVPIANLNTGTAAPLAASENGTGTFFKLGLALQDGATPGDEILVLIGGSR
jgi:hypothetical protein